MESRLFTAAICCILWVSAASGQETRRIYIVSHGWHTGLVVPLASVDLDTCPALLAFRGWSHVEIGWGDEGFYRGGDAISIGVALKAVATPTPTVLHVVGVSTPVEEFFASSEVVAIDLDAESFNSLCQFVRATFASDATGAPTDLGDGIYGTSRFFRARGSYYFPNTCNVWTLRTLEAAGIDVFPFAGIRAENVITQAAKHGESIRRSQGRSRSSVLVAMVVASGLALTLRKKKRLRLLAWSAWLLAIVAVAGVTMASVNQIAIPAWLPSWLAWLTWATTAFIGAAHGMALREQFRWRHVIPTFVATLAMIVGISPL